MTTITPSYEYSVKTFQIFEMVQLTKTTFQIILSFEDDVTTLL